MFVHVGASYIGLDNDFFQSDTILHQTMWRKPLISPQKTVFHGWLLYPICLSLSFCILMVLMSRVHFLSLTTKIPWIAQSLQSSNKILLNNVKIVVKVSWFLRKLYGALIRLSFISPLKVDGQCCWGWRLIFFNSSDHQWAGLRTKTGKLFHPRGFSRRLSPLFLHSVTYDYRSLSGATAFQLHPTFKVKYYTLNPPLLK